MPNQRTARGGPLGGAALGVPLAGEGGAAAEQDVQNDPEAPQVHHGGVACRVGGLGGGVGTPSPLGPEASKGP